MACTFNEVGSLATVTNSHGTSTRTYNDRERLVNIAYPNAPPVSFTYDTVGNRLTMTDGIGLTTWTYHPLTDRIATVTDSFGKTLEFTYDTNGNRDSIKYPGNKLASYTFDPANRLTAMNDWLGHNFSQTYSDAGRLQSIAYPNSTTTSLGYDTAGRMNSIRHAKGAAASFETLPYVIDAAGDITSTPNRPHISAPELPRTDAYTYDQAGQINTLNTIPFTHNADGAITAGPLTRDSLGNDALTYDFESRTVAANIGTSQIISRYNGIGHRLEMTRNGATTRFIVDGTGPLAQILTETDNTGVISAYYLYFGGLAARVAADGTVSYYHGDRNGNTIALTNQNGDVTDSYAYDEFGYPTATIGTTPNPFRALGRHGVYDNADSTLYIRARNYQPDLGRFLSKDLYAGSDANTQSVNRYVYALNNPVRMIDVSGFKAQQGNYQLVISGGTDGVHAPLFGDSGFIDTRVANSTSPLPEAFYIRVPLVPSNVDISENIEIAKQHNSDILWFYNQTRNKAPWDYKQLGSEYQEFGNFHFGVVGSAVGIPTQVLLRGAGWAQQKAGTSDAEWGGPLDILGPYGDDPKDQALIMQGIKWYNAFYE